MSNLDMRLLGKLLYYQSADLAVHRPSENAALHYELNPGASAVFSGNRKVTINSLGFRDPPGGAAKPAGVIRIICLGASNTYGALVNDEETYPVQLERLLNGRARGKYEVWNAGVSAYTLPQNVAAAKEILRKYSPDLLIFQLSNSNCGRRPFLAGQPFEKYFELDPGLYRENLRFCWPRQLNFLRHWRLFRGIFFTINQLNLPADRSPFNLSARGYDLNKCSALQVNNNRVFKEFYEENRRKVRMAFLLYPGETLDDDLASLGIPAVLLAEGLPRAHDREFYEIHPPAHVYRWYALELLRVLSGKGLYI